MNRDYALTQDLVLHRADCPTARIAAGLGQLVLTMLDCEAPPPAHYPRHTCLQP